MMISRREFIIISGSTFAAGGHTVFAQQHQFRRVGFLSPQSASSAAPLLAALREGLRDLGWIEGQNLAFELRYADGSIDELPELAAELVQLKLDVIVVGSNLGALAAKRASSSLPIVMVTTGDPVTAGLIEGLARPGANVTGVTAINEELSGKRLELLKEAVPGLRRVAALANPDSPQTVRFSREAPPAAKSLNLELEILEARTADQMGAAFAEMLRGNTQALIVNADILFMTHRRHIVELAAKSRLPALYFERAFVFDGGLMFYGAGLRDMYRHSAIHVDKVLKGAKPADLPVEQPLSLELVINMKTAKALGISIPPSLLARADEVIE